MPYSIHIEFLYIIVVFIIKLTIPFGTAVEIYYLWHNNITYNCFIPFFRMLRNNRISCIHNNSFTGLYNVRLLSLYDNQLTTISPGAFDTLQTLSTLYVRTQFPHYFLILSTYFDFFILALRLTENQPNTSLPQSSVFVYLGDSSNLELVSNFLSSSSGVTELVFISMKETGFFSDFIYSDFSVLQFHLIFFCSCGRNLLANSFNCDCRLAWLGDWLRTRKIVTGNPRCQRPAFLKEIPLQDVALPDFRCEDGRNSLFLLTQNMFFNVAS